MKLRWFQSRERTVPAADGSRSIRVKDVMPLVGFLVPTVAIGYGVVIPRSCIAGVNELTIGFGATLFGAAVTYLLGVRSARRS